MDYDLAGPPGRFSIWGLLEVGMDTEAALSEAVKNIAHEAYLGDVIPAANVCGPAIQIAYIRGHAIVTVIIYPPASLSDSITMQLWVRRTASKSKLVFESSDREDFITKARAILLLELTNDSDGGAA